MNVNLYYTMETVNKRIISEEELEWRHIIQLQNLTPNTLATIKNT